MVLELILDPLYIRKHPFFMFLIGIIYSLIAIFVSLFFFKPFASLVMVFFTVIGCASLISSIIKAEEKNDEDISSEFILLERHSKMIKAYLLLFVGFVVTFSLFYVFVPDESLVSSFSAQHRVINSVNHKDLPVDGNFHFNGNALSIGQTLMKIISNNIVVMMVCLLLSFFYGYGALIVISFNASVIGTAIGNIIREKLSSALSITSYFTAFSYGFGRYLLHGIPEISAYIVTALAGGMLSLAFVKLDYFDKKFKRILLDCSYLIIISLIIIVISGIIEVFITPFFFY